MALPPEARAPKKKIRRRATAPTTTDRTSPNPSPAPKPKKGPVAPQQTGKVTRPAPKTQPGPSSNAERKKIRKAKTQAPYQDAIREARKHGPATRRGTSRPGGDDKSDTDRARAKDYVRQQYAKEYGKKLGTSSQGGKIRYGYRPGSTVPPDVQKRVDKSHLKDFSDEAGATRLAPVGKVLEQTTRPLHGIAAGTRAAIKGKNVPKAVGRGLQNKDKSTFSDVLKDVGAPKVVQATVGTALDIAADPTTYVTFGAGTVAKQAATQAARQAEKQALKQGLSKEQAKRFGERAAKQAARKAPEGSGATVKFAGREAPGVRKATAKVGRGVKTATDKPKMLRKVKDAARHVAADVNPNIKPDNISRADYEAVRRATRTARSSTAREVHKVKQRAHAIRKSVGKDDQQVLDAIEAGKRKDLPDHLRAPAKRLEDQFKYARRLERHAGIPTPKLRSKDGEPKGYVPHALKEPLEKGEGIQSVGAKKIEPGFTKGRKERRPLAEIRKTDPEKYSEDAALLHANRLVSSVVATKKADLNRTLLDMGRRLKKGSTDVLADGEAVVQIKGSDIRILDSKKDKAEVDALLREGVTRQGGQYVILNEQTVDRAIKNVVPAEHRSTIGRAIDKGQGGWKWLATVPNPGFHVRNLVGDTQNAYLAERADKLARNTRHSAKALKRLGKREEALRTITGALDPSGKGLKIKDRHVTYDELLDEAEKVGAIRSGFINRELPELVKNPEASGLGKPGKLRRAGQKVSQSRGGRSVGRTLQNREDLMRLATYIGSRKRGLSPEDAAARMSKYHFDYADLTTFERSVMRRLMPFYTFSARNIPLQLKSLFQKPGKFANYQKIREETAKAFGIDLDEADASTAEYEQRAAPLHVKWKGKQFTLSFGPSGLPLTDLNEMPVSTDPLKAADEWMERAMSLVTPVAKTPVELWSNFSFFFRDQIERETGPLVPMSSALAESIPKALHKKLGIVPDFVDPRSGKKGWGWPAKVDYVSHIMPGPLNYINRVTTASDRKGQGTLEKSLAYGGLRVTPLDKISVDIQGMYEERAKVGKKEAALRQRKHPKNDQKISADNPTPEYTKLLAEHKRLSDAIAAGREKRGDKLVPRRGRPSAAGGSTGASQGTSDSFWSNGGSSDSFWDD